MKLRKWFQLAREAAALIKFIVRLFTHNTPPRSGKPTDKESENGKNQL